MPGYRALALRVAGDTADLIREAEEKQRDGQVAQAITILEEAVDAAVKRDGILPGWACGRLAALYRSVERYDDEVLLLERYCESSITEKGRMRFIARLSKARAMADRARASESGALRTVRDARRRLGRSPRRRAGPADNGGTELHG